MVCTSSRACCSSRASSPIRAEAGARRGVAGGRLAGGVATSETTIITVLRSSFGSASRWTVTSTVCVPPFVPTRTPRTVTGWSSLIAAENAAESS